MFPVRNTFNLINRLRVPSFAFLLTVTINWVLKNSDDHVLQYVNMWSYDAQCTIDSSALFFILWPLKTSSAKLFDGFINKSSCLIVAFLMTSPLLVISIKIRNSSSADYLLCYYVIITLIKYSHCEGQHPRHHMTHGLYVIYVFWLFETWSVKCGDYFLLINECNSHRTVTKLPIKNYKTASSSLDSTISCIHISWLALDNYDRFR